MLRTVSTVFYSALLAASPILSHDSCKPFLCGCNLRIDVSRILACAHGYETPIQQIYVLVKGINQIFRRARSINCAYPSNKLVSPCKPGRTLFHGFRGSHALSNNVSRVLSSNDFMRSNRRRNYDHHQNENYPLRSRHTM
jgi:hypothetical protein